MKPDIFAPRAGCTLISPEFACTRTLLGRRSLGVVGDAQQQGATGLALRHDVPPSAVSFFASFFLPIGSGDGQRIC